MEKINNLMHFGQRKKQTCLNILLEEMTSYMNMVDYLFLFIGR